VHELLQLPNVSVTLKTLFMAVGADADAAKLRKFLIYTAASDSEGRMGGLVRMPPREP
jgi:hypothetical protein